MGGFKQLRAASLQPLARKKTGQIQGTEFCPHHMSMEVVLSNSQNSDETPALADTMTPALSATGVEDPVTSCLDS